MLLFLIQLFALSALATDYTQTQHWAQYTEDSPYCIDHIRCAWEINPIVAGSHDALDDFAAFVETAIHAAPYVVGDEAAALGTLVQGILHFASIIANNALAPEFGYPQYVMIAYSWSF